MFSMSAGPIDPVECHERLLDDASGACVTFEGWVRNENEGRDVRELEYEGYESVAVKEGERILDEAREKFDLRHAVCIHRVGHLSIGDLAVWVGVSSGHRGQAFDACRYIIDELKTRLPIWKKEYYAEGDSGWIHCDPGARIGAKPE